MFKRTTKPQDRLPKRLPKRLLQNQQLHQPKQLKRWLWLALCLVSFWVSIACGALRVPAAIAHPTPPSLKTHSLETSSTVASWQTDLTAGIAAFEAGRLTEAIAHWQTALSAAASASPLTRAYLLSNLATAQQQLGNASAARTALTESLGIVQSWPDQSQEYWEVTARVFNTRGQLQWHQGETRRALTSWQQAESYYQNALQQAQQQRVSEASSAQPTSKQSSESENLGLVRSQINQAIALQELGLNVRALEKLQDITQSSNPVSTRLQLTTAKALGKALRRIGELSDAQSVLLGSLQTAIAAPSAAPTEIAKQQITLELGHTLRSLSHRAITIGKVSEAQTYRDQAVAYYSAVEADDATQAAPPPASQWLQLQAQLNRLSFLIETNQLGAAQALWPQIDLSSLAPGRDRTEAHISYAHSLNCLQSTKSVACVRTEWQPTLLSTAASQPSAEEQIPWPAIATVLTSAIQQAQSLADPLLESYAVGELAHTYELANQTDEAIRLTQQALSLLEGKQTPEAAYRWEWQLGRLYSQSSQTVAAKSAYQQALTSLAAVRQNLLLTNPQAQFSFRDDVEPLYREFVALLLQQQASDGQLPEIETDETQSLRDSLSLVVKTLDALQLTELENFLGCNLSQLVNLNEVRVDAKAAKIYPILLPEQLAIIVDLPNQPLSLRTLPVSQAEVEQTLTTLRNNLTLPGKTPEVIASASQLYQWLIAPIEPILLANEQIETLVFVSDGPLRNVPMGVLYDGQQYLIEKDYAIAIAPQLSLFAPRT
ncbi:MAG: CHAT domain-containing protein, partial [Cyanobacteria bacterium J06607_13]